MRILTLTNCPLDPHLGSGRTVLRYSEGLRALGQEVEVLQPSDYQWLVNVPHGKRFNQALGAASAISRRLRGREYDVIEFYGAEFWLITSALARRRERPLLVAHTNGLELLHLERQRESAAALSQPMRTLRDRVSAAIQSPLMRRFFATTDAFVSLCEADRRYVVDHGLFPEARTRVVEPGLDTEFLHARQVGLEAREPRICFTGTWTPRKGLKAIEAVIPAVLRARPRVIFDVFGTFAEPEAIRSAFPHDVRARVVVHPRLSNRDLAAALSRGAVFFFPSEYEGYGMALAEALACGLAAVATPTGLGSTLRNGQEALICGFGDHTTMADSLSLLLDNDDLRRRIAVGGQRYVQRLSWPEVCAELAACYADWTPAQLPGTR